MSEKYGRSWARGNRVHLTAHDHPQTRKASAAMHLRLVAGRYLRGRANEADVDEAIRWWREAKA